MKKYKNIRISRRIEELFEYEITTITNKCYILHSCSELSQILRRSYLEVEDDKYLLMSAVESITFKGAIKEREVISIYRTSRFSNILESLKVIQKEWRPVEKE